MRTRLISAGLISTGFLAFPGCASSPCALYSCPEVVIRHDAGLECPRGEIAVAVNRDSRPHSFRVKRVVRSERDISSAAAGIAGPESPYTSGAPAGSQPASAEVGSTTTWEGPYTVEAGQEMRLGCTLQEGLDKLTPSIHVAFALVDVK